MAKLYLDFETRSELDLSIKGLHNYVTHPSTQILMMAFAFDDEPPALWEPRLGSMPERVNDGLSDLFTTKISWNVGFERHILKFVLSRDIPLDEWLDPSVWAKHVSIPGSLNDASEVLGLEADQAKLTDGTRLINMFCYPVCEARTDSLFGSERAIFRDWTTDPADWDKFCNYCLQDIVAERAILRKLQKFPLPAIEQKGWELDQRINERGVPIDPLLCRNGLHISDQAKYVLGLRMKKITGLDNPNSRAQLLPWAQKNGYPYKSLGKPWVERALNGKLPADCREVFELRQQASKTSASKLEAIEDIVSTDGRVRNQFSFLGSSRCGRWCLAEGSLIRVKQPNGVILDKPIEQVLIEELLWDGENWVRHEGAVYSGDKEVIDWDGVVASPDHRVWVNSINMAPLSEARDFALPLWRGNPQPYLIYRLTSPSGKFYIGLTKQPLKERWRHHVIKSTKQNNHPLYNAIRKYGADSFLKEIIDMAPNKVAAQELEMRHIASSPSELLYNVSPGGEADGETGSRIFWERMNLDPFAKQAYLDKLSQVKKSNDWSDYEKLTKLRAEWRRQNPKEAYNNARRASRIAAKKTSSAPKLPKVSENKLKRRLRRGAWVSAMWKNRTQEERRAVGEKIAAASAKNWTAVTDPKIRQQKTQRARDAVDREKQARCASAGLKKFWHEIRKDPIKYQEYMTKRTASLMRTLNANL